MAKFRNLPRRLDRLASRLEAAVEDLVGEVGAEIGREVVLATPVDTGFTRANWRGTLNAPATRPVAFTDRSGAQTVAKIRAAAAQFRIGQSLHIVNRAPAIGELNEGASPQAEAGFVGNAVRRGLSRGVRAAVERRGGVL